MKNFLDKKFLKELISPGNPPVQILFWILVSCLFHLWFGWWVSVGIGMVTLVFFGLIYLFWEDSLDTRKEEKNDKIKNKK